MSNNIPLAQKLAKIKKKIKMMKCARDPLIVYKQSHLSRYRARSTVFQNFYRKFVPADCHGLSSHRTHYTRVFVGRSSIV